MGAFGCRSRIDSITLWITCVALVVAAAGCGPSYLELRRHGQAAVLESEYALARSFFEMAEEKQPQRAENLHDLGDCSIILAREQFVMGNQAAAMREVDRAIAYFDRAITTQPGHRAALKGKNIALELKGQFDEALRQVQWAAEFVGPSAEQQVWLAREHEERGDYDLALRRFRQAVAMEPRSAEAHIAFAEFLLRRNNERAAVAHYQIAYRIDPSNRRAAEPLIARNALPQAVTAGDSNP